MTFDASITGSNHDGIRTNIERLYTGVSQGGRLVVDEIEQVLDQLQG